MKLGVTVSMRNDPHELVQQAQRLEAAGVAYLWTGEAYTADAVSTLGFLAAVTTTVQIGSNILPIYTRTPTLLAMTAIGLDRASSRAVQPRARRIGSAGDRRLPRRSIRPAVGAHAGDHRGVPNGVAPRAARARWPAASDPAPAGPGHRVRQAAEDHRRPLRERSRSSSPRWPEERGDDRRNAEGWLPLRFWPDRARELWGASLSAGAAKRAPGLPPLEIAVGGDLAIGDDVESRRDDARPMLALYFGGMGARGRNYYNDLLRRYGFESEAEEIQNLYLGGKRQEAEAAVPQALVDGMSLIGDEGYVRERVAAYREAGVTILNVRPVGPNGIKDVETIASWLA